MFLFLAGAFFLGIGALISHAGSTGAGVVIGVFGGAVNALGVLVLSVFIVPMAIQRLGGLASLLGGVPGRVAAANCQRNPRRTTSTAVALMIGVALVSMMTVGGAMVQDTFANDIDSYNPIDVTMTIPNPGDIAFPDLVRDVRSIEEVNAVAETGTMTTTASETSKRKDDPLDVTFVNPNDARSVTRSTDAIQELAPGVAVVSFEVASTYGLASSDALVLTGPDGKVRLRTVITDVPDGNVLIAAEDAGIVHSGAWIRLDDDGAFDDVQDQLFDLGDQYGVQPTIQGTAASRAQMNSILDRMVLIVTGLLGVGVLISLIGIGNTLSLSVIERTRESALLRSLGCTRRQLRTMLAVEGVMLAVAGALIGVVVGMFYGVVGGLTLLASEDSIAISVPISRLVWFIEVATIAGFLASVLPARRAVTADPVVALAKI